MGKMTGEERKSAVRGNWKGEREKNRRELVVEGESDNVSCSKFKSV